MISDWQIINFLDLHDWAADKKWNTEYLCSFTRQKSKNEKLWEYKINFLDSCEVINKNLNNYRKVALFENSFMSTFKNYLKSFALNINFMLSCHFYMILLYISQCEFSWIISAVWRLNTFPIFFFCWLIINLMFENILLTQIGLL